MIININLHELALKYGVDKYNFFVLTEENKVTVLYGETTESGIVGVGATHEAALEDFDRNWRTNHSVNAA